MHNNQLPLQLLGGLSPEQFMSEYWQKKPLIIRQAFPAFESPVTPDELAGLALEDIVESRIILENGKSGPWEIRRGPFSESDFEALPDSHWTLLIQQLDAWLPEIDELKRLFQFIPNWRIDDIMASYAPVGGSVGPHFDHYDVFLLQAFGERRWQIGQMCNQNSDTLENTPLSILTRFDEQETWTLEPGDMLYLPPKLAHYGVALNECITLSVGFRAPTHEQLLSHFTDYLIDKMESNAFYEDPDLKPSAHCGEISDNTLDKISDILQNQLGNRQALRRWFGTYLTEAKNESIFTHEESDYSSDELDILLDEGHQLRVNEGSRIAYTISDANIAHEDDLARTSREFDKNLVSHDKCIDLFIDGHLYQVSVEALEFVQHLSQATLLNLKIVKKSTNVAQIKDLLVDLLNQGSLYFVQD